MSGSERRLDQNFTAALDLGPAGPSDGRNTVIAVTTMTKNSARMMPGRMPAMNSLPMLCSVRMA